VKNYLGRKVVASLLEPDFHFSEPPTVTTGIYGFVFDIGSNPSSQEMALMPVEDRLCDGTTTME